jgi:SAM-dependent methyltransferase
LLAWELAMFDALVADRFGFNAVQLGSMQIDALRSNRMPCRVRVCCVDEDPDGCDLLVDQFEALPFDTQSLDLLVLPHVLEFAQDPHQVLREAERVLRPEGRLVLAGFNPVSLWGLRDWLGRPFERGFFPKPAHVLSALRLRDWCKLLDLSVESIQHGCFRPIDGWRELRSLNRPAIAGGPSAERSIC